MKNLFYIFLLITSFSFAQNNSLFEQANALYNDGKFNEAIAKYEAVLQTGQHSSELYFNLANANYKLNKIAPSIYYYEKAALLNPEDKDIKNNLAFAKNMTIDAIDTMPEVGFSKIIKSATNTFSFDVWAYLSVACMLLFVVLFLVYYFTYATSKKRLAFVSSLVSLAICFITLAFAFHKSSIDNNNNPAIVFAQETKVKSEPNLRSAEAFKLHEGTKVQVLETVDNWKKIKLTDGKVGWIPSEDLKLLKNF